MKSRLRPGIEMNGESKRWRSRKPLSVRRVLLFLMACCGAVEAQEKFTLLTERLPPYSIMVDGVVTGAGVDIVSELFRRANIPFDVFLLPWKRAELAAKTQSAHCFFPVQRSQENEVMFTWISPIVISHSAFYTLKDSAYQIRTLDDVQGLNIGTYRGSGVAHYLQDNGFTLDLTVIDAPNLDKLKLGRLDVWAADTLTAHYLAKQSNTSELKEQLVYFTTLRALACHPDTPESTVEKLNKVLKGMYVDGSIDDIVDRYR